MNQNNHEQFDFTLIGTKSLTPEAETPPGPADPVPAPAPVPLPPVE
jgi:hypothetical protein